MNQIAANQQPLHAQIYGAAPGGLTAMRTDAQGRPVLRLDATQTIAASSFDIRNLTAADVAAITATGFDIRNLNGSRDSVTTVVNPFTVLFNTATLLLGGTTVLSVDTSPYSSSAFLVRADFISLLTAANLQQAPINSNNYFATVNTQSGLLLGGEYLFVPTVQMRYARIYATGVGSSLTAYYIGQV